GDLARQLGPRESREQLVSDERPGPRQEPDQDGQACEQAGRSGGTDGYGRVVVERSGGVGGMLMAWELDIGAGAGRDALSRQVAELPWSRADAEASAAARTGGADMADGGGADRSAYRIESRYGRVRFGEARMPQEWKGLVDDVRH